MKFRRLAIALFVPFFIACTIGVTAWQREHSLLYASPETESTFLKSYTPKPVIDRFRENKGFSGGGGIGGGAGHSFVTHQGHFQFHVVLRRENWLPLMNALRDDVLRQLVDNDAEVLSKAATRVAHFALTTESIRASAR